MLPLVCFGNRKRTIKSDKENWVKIASSTLNLTRLYSTMSVGFKGKIPFCTGTYCDGKNEVKPYVIKHYKFKVNYLLFNLLELIIFRKAP